MHLPSTILLLASLLLTSAFAIPHPQPETPTDRVGYTSYLSPRPLHYTVRARRSALANAYIRSELKHARRSYLKRRAL